MFPSINRILALIVVVATTASPQLLGRTLVCAGELDRPESSTDGWLQFRGPTGNGHSTQEQLPTHWGGLFDKPLWKTTIPGHGWSSPIVVGDHVWITTAESTALIESKREMVLAENPYGTDDFQSHERVELLVLKLDLASGKIVKRIELSTIESPPSIHSLNSYASPTPASDGRRVYCHFGSLGTFAVDCITDEIVWHRKVDFAELTGPASSPIVWNDRLILACDGADRQFILALDTENGKTIWETERPSVDVSDEMLKRAFSTPLLVEGDNRQQLLTTTAQWAVSYNPETGREWWRARIGNGYSLIPQPVFDSGIAYFCSGYISPELFAVATDGDGDVSQTKSLWKYSKQVSEIASPIIVGDRIYMVSTRGIATCLDRSTGNKIWTQRLEGSYAASPIVFGDRIYFTNQSGVTTIIRASDSFEILARNELFGETMASLVPCKLGLLIRTAPDLHCISNDPKP